MWVGQFTPEMPRQAVAPIAGGGTTFGLRGPPGVGCVLSLCALARGAAIWGAGRRCNTKHYSTFCLHADSTFKLAFCAAAVNSNLYLTNWEIIFMCVILKRIQHPHFELRSGGGRPSRCEP